MQNYLATVTIGDFVGPETLAQLDLIEDEDFDYKFLSEEQLESIMGTAMSQAGIWDRLWRFGIIVDDDLDYYVPDDWDSEIPLVSLDG